ncbi:immunoglobulin lambda-1 light chain [Gadus morhua]|uniref:immunoglobulin lambda-1 light chain n=1 Tax=Gadus morhua TaxID=8049 RepID=UPI0011B38228|nr:immunoglobulin lambda-1 light chain-like [Gadus morhua]
MEDRQSGSLAVREANVTHTAVYFCAAGLAAVPVPVQPGDLTLQPGAAITLTCSLASDMSSYTMLWYRQHVYGDPIEFIIKEYDTSRGRFKATLDTKQNRFSLGISELQVNDSGTFYCAATNSEPAFFGKGTKLTVLEPGCIVSPPTVVVLPPSEKECRDRKEQLKKTLVCVASGFYPDHVSVSWTVNGQSVIKGVASDHPALRVDDKYQITSRLRVEARKWYTGGNIFTCNVSFFNGNDTIYTSAEVYGGVDVRWIKTEPDGETREEFVKVTQTAKLSYIVMIVKNIVYGVFVTILAWKLGLGRSHATAKK